MSTTRRKGVVMRVLSTMMSAILAFGSFPGLSSIMGITTTAMAADSMLVVTDVTVSAPEFNPANLPEKNTDATVQYWYGGNAFYALKNFNDGFAENAEKFTVTGWTIKDTSNVSHTATVAYGTEDDGRPYVEVTGTTSANAVRKYRIHQRESLTDDVWELIDTDARWDDDYLHTPWTSNTTGTTGADSILSYPDNVKSYLSDAEIAAVKQTPIDTINTTVNTYGQPITLGQVISSVESAHFFAPSVVDSIYNKTAMQNIVNATRSDKITTTGANYRNNTTARYVRFSDWGSTYCSWDSTNQRTLGGEVAHAIVSSGANNLSNGFFATASDANIAPAFLLDIASVKMAKKAQEGSTITASSTIPQYSVNATDLGDNVKFLVQNESLAPLFTTDIDGKWTSNVVAGNTYTISYEGASSEFVDEAGNNNNGKLVISAAIYDADGKIVNYGPVANVADSTGTANIQIPSDLSGNYTLAIFEEQLGGTSAYVSEGGITNTNYETDYMSGGVSYSKISVVNSFNALNVTMNNTDPISCYRTYTKADLADKFVLFRGTTTIPADDYYIMTEEAFGNLTAYDKATVTANENVDKIPLPDYVDEIGVMFLYYETASSDVQVTKAMVDVSRPESLTITLKPNAKIMEDTQYDAETADDIFLVKCGELEIEKGDYYFVETEKYSRMEDKSKAALDALIADEANHDVNEFKTKPGDSTDKKIDLTFVYYPSGTIVLTGEIKGTVTNGTLSYDNSIELKAGILYERDENGVLWKFKVNENGDIVYLYTESSTTRNIVETSSNTLIVPMTVNGLRVVGIGGGTADTPFVPSTMTGWRNIYIPSTVETINDYAFYRSMSNAKIDIPGTVTKIGDKAFYSSNITGLNINHMSGTIGYRAFANTASMQAITIKGNGLTVGEEAFNACGVRSLSLSGSGIDIGPKGFYECTGLTALYLPNGVTTSEYAFGNCTSITDLEVDMATLSSKSFDGANAIKLLILDDNVSTVDYDWNGIAGNTPNRNVYVKNPNTQFKMHKEGSSYVSPFGLGGNVSVYYDNNQAEEDTSTVDPSTTDISKNCETLGRDGSLSPWYTGSAIQVTFEGTNNVATSIANNGDSFVDATSEVLTGISAYYNGPQLFAESKADKFVGSTLNKADVIVKPLFGSHEGEPLNTDQFAVIRENDFVSLEQAENVTAESLAEKDHIHIDETDATLASGGTLVLEVVAIFNDEEGHTAYKNTPLTLHIEKFDPKKYIYAEYEDYQSIVEQILALKTKVDELNNTIEQKNLEIGTLTATINALSVVNDDLEKTKTELTEKIAELDTTIAEMEARYNALSDKESQEAKDLAKAIEDAKKTRQDLADQLEKIEKLIRENTGLKDRISNLKQQRDDLQAQYNALEDTTTEEAKNLRDRINLLNSEIERMEDLQEQIDAAILQKQQLEKEVQEARDAMALLGSDYNKLVERHAELTAMLRKFSEDHDGHNLGYTGTDKDGNPVVYILGKVLRYSIESGVDYNVDGHPYTLYTGQWEDGTEFKFYVALDGIHIVKENGEEELIEETLGESIQRATRILDELNEKLNNMNNNLNEAADALREAGIEVEVGADGNISVTQIKEAIAQLLLKYGMTLDQWADLKSKIFGGKLSNEELADMDLQDMLDQLAGLYGGEDEICAMIEKIITGKDVDPKDAKALAALLKDIEKMKGQVTDSNSLITNLKNLLNATNEDPQTIFAAVSEIVAENATLKSQNDQKDRKIAELEAEIAALKSNPTGDVVSRTQYDELLATVNGLKNERDEWKDKYETLKKDYEGSDVSTLKAQITTLNSQITNLNKKVDTLTDKNASLQEKNATVTGENAGLKATNSSLQSENSSLKSDKSSLESKNKSLQSELDKLKASGTSSGSSSGSNSTNTQLQKENNTLKTENATLKKDKEDLQKQLEELKKKVNPTEEEKQQIEKLQKQLTSLQQSNKTLTTKNTELEKENEALNEKLKRLQDSPQAPVEPEVPDDPDNVDNPDTKDGGFPVALVAGLILLLLGGAGAAVYFFIFRKPKAPADVADDFDDDDEIEIEDEDTDFGMSSDDLTEESV